MRWAVHLLYALTDALHYIIRELPNQFDIIFSYNVSQAAPIGKEDKNVPLALGKGYTLLHGAICAPALNQVFEVR